jgi:hypothetical protein
MNDYRNHRLIEHFRYFKCDPCASRQKVGRCNSDYEPIAEVFPNAKRIMTVRKSYPKIHNACFIFASVVHEGKEPMVQCGACRMKGLKCESWNEGSLGDWVDFMQVTGTTRNGTCNGALFWLWQVPPHIL